MAHRRSPCAIAIIRHRKLAVWVCAKISPYAVGEGLATPVCILLCKENLQYWFARMISKTEWADSISAHFCLYKRYCFHTDRLLTPVPTTKYVKILLFDTNPLFKFFAKLSPKESGKQKTHRFILPNRCVFVFIIPFHRVFVYVFSPCFIIIIITDYVVII